MKFENCVEPDPVIKFDPNPTITLSKKCELIMTGCGETKGFKEAKVGPCRVAKFEKFWIIEWHNFM